MSTGLFKEIGFIKADQLEMGPHTPGQVRKKALEVGDLWVGQCHVTALDAPSQWHQHGAIGLSLHAVELPEGSDIERGECASGSMPLSSAVLIRG